MGEALWFLYWVCLHAPVMCEYATSGYQPAHNLAGGLGQGPLGADTQAASRGAVPAGPGAAGGGGSASSTGGAAAGQGRGHEGRNSAGSTGPGMLPGQALWRWWLHCRDESEAAIAAAREAAHMEGPAAPGLLLLPPAAASVAWGQYNEAVQGLLSTMAPHLEPAAEELAWQRAAWSVEGVCGGRSVSGGTDGFEGPLQRRSSRDSTAKSTAHLKGAARHRRALSGGDVLASMAVAVPASRSGTSASSAASTAAAAFSTPPQPLVRASGSGMGSGGGSGSIGGGLGGSGALSSGGSSGGSRDIASSVSRVISVVEFSAAPTPAATGKSAPAPAGSQAVSRRTTTGSSSGSLLDRASASGSGSAAAGNSQSGGGGAAGAPTDPALRRATGDSLHSMTSTATDAGSASAAASGAAGVAGGSTPAPAVPGAARRVTTDSAYSHAGAHARHVRRATFDCLAGWDAAASGSGGLVSRTSTPDSGIITRAPSEGGGSIVAPTAAATAAEAERLLQVLLDLSLYGPGGFIVDRLVTPLFLLLAHEVRMGASELNDAYFHAFSGWLFKHLLKVVVGLGT